MAHERSEVLAVIYQLLEVLLGCIPDEGVIVGALRR